MSCKEGVVCTMGNDGRKAAKTLFPGFSSIPAFLSSPPLISERPVGSPVYRSTARTALCCAPIFKSNFFRKPTGRQRRAGNPWGTSENGGGKYLETYYGAGYVIAMREGTRSRPHSSQDEASAKGVPLKHSFQIPSASLGTV